jgi:hypothetical protein
MRRPLLALVTFAALAVAAATAHTPDASAQEAGSVTRRWRPPVAAAPRVEVVGEGLQPLPTFAQDGRRFVLGAMGERYRIHLVNPTAARVEALISIDGLDAIDGRPASLGKRGYVLPAFADVTIDGWRTSMDTVAAFRFASVRDSYAARTSSDRDVGVIGVAFFRERPPVVVRALPPMASRGAAPSAAPAPKAAMEDRAGLGTRFGESHDSSVVETSFVRADASPMATSELRYDDRQGLFARGIAVPAPFDGRQVVLDRRDSATPFPGDRFAQAPR